MTTRPTSELFRLPKSESYRDLRRKHQAIEQGARAEMLAFLTAKPDSQAIAQAQASMAGESRSRADGLLTAFRESRTERTAVARAAGGVSAEYLHSWRRDTNLAAALRARRAKALAPCGGALVAAGEFVPDFFSYIDGVNCRVCYGDGSSNPDLPDGVIRELPDNRHYWVRGSDVDVQITHNAKMQLGSDQWKCVRLFGSMSLQGMVDNIVLSWPWPGVAGSVRLSAEVVMLQFRGLIDRPPDIWAGDLPLREYRSVCIGGYPFEVIDDQPWLHSSPQIEHILDVECTDVMAGDWFVCAQYAIIQSNGYSLVDFQLNNVGTIAFPSCSYETYA